MKQKYIFRSSKSNCLFDIWEITFDGESNIISRQLVKAGLSFEMAEKEVSK